MATAAVRKEELKRVTTTAAAERCSRKFLRFFPSGFQDEKYFNWERGYKWSAHLQWQQVLNREAFKELLKSRGFKEIAETAIRIESRTNLLFSFEKMALRDAVRETSGARVFAEGLYELLYGISELESRFEKWCAAVERLPRKQTRVLNHPVVTVFPFIAVPTEHIFLKPNVTRRAAAAYGFDFKYRSRPGIETYSSLLQFAAKLKKDLRPLKPKDMIDIQSFMWVLGSDEYS